jgi:two-component system NtrC family sensor kinase
MAMLRKSLGLGLKWKLILVVGSLLLVSCASLSYFLIGEFSDSAVTALRHHAESLAKGLAHNAEFGVMLEIGPELDALNRSLMSDPDILFVQVFNLDGKLLSETLGQNLRVREAPHLGGIERFRDLFSRSTTPLTTAETLPNGLDYIDAIAPVYLLKEDVAKEELGSTRSLMERQGQARQVIGLVRIAVGLQSTQAQIATTTQLILVFSSILVMVGILLSIGLVKMISKPIDKMVSATELIAAGDLSQRVEVSADKELARLAEAFNQMCDSLQQTQHEIESYNQTLEQKIRERTDELEEAQQQIVQSEKMAAVGQLAAGVAHELNNPLGGILGYAQFGLEKLERGGVQKEDLNDYRRYLSDIEIQARRCKLIVKNLLKFSRSSAKTEFEYFNVNHALEETFMFSKHQLDMNNVELVIQPGEGLPQIYGNSNLLQQVFTNLILNGMQAMPEGGRMVVETIRKPATENSAGTVEIIFTDNGVGISEENIAKILEPFFTTKKVGQGTGLGLSVSYGIVQEHGGDIKIASQHGVGSTFTVVLPIVTEKVGSQATV